MITGVSSLSAYSRVQTFAVQAAKTAKLPSVAYNQELSDKVSISNAAREILAADSPAMAQSRTPMQEKRLNDLADAAPGFAEEAVENFVTARRAMLFDIREEINGFFRPGGILKLTSTGRLVDKAFIERVDEDISLVDAKIRALYTSEKDKGTPSVEIMGKVFDLINSQSKDYLEAIDWG